jgi:spore coat polysaccharide biosynthesis predicted glycosyltransferase SpsG
MRNNTEVLSIRNQPEVQHTIAQFAEEVDYIHGETFRVVIGPKTMSVTLDSKNVDKLISKLPKARIVKRIENLAEIVIDMTSEADKTVGAISAITTELAINDVNLIQLSTIGPGHILILVEEGDATNAYQALDRMARSKS